MAGMGALPPMHVYAAKFSNNDEYPVQLTVVYTGASGVEEAVQTEVDPGSTYTIEAKTRDEGSWTSAMQVQRVTVTSAGPSNAIHVIEAPFNVNSPTDNYVFECGSGNDGKLNIRHYQA